MCQFCVNPHQSVFRANHNTITLATYNASALEAFQGVGHIAYHQKYWWKCFTYYLKLFYTVPHQNILFVSLFSSLHSPFYLHLLVHHYIYWHITTNCRWNSVKTFGRITALNHLFLSCTYNLIDSCWYMMLLQGIFPQNTLCVKTSLSAQNLLLVLPNSLTFP